MWKVGFFCRSRGPAAVAVRNVLDQYALRVGDRAWAARVSEVGLSVIRRALQDGATKRTSVSCMLIEGGRFRLRWIVGARAGFSAGGEIPMLVGSSGHAPSVKSVAGSKLPLVVAVTRAGGGGHDVGKVSPLMQAKMKVNKDPSPDAIRHEVLSIAMLLGLSQPLPPHPLLSQPPRTFKECSFRVGYTHHRLEPEVGRQVSSVPGMNMAHPVVAKLGLKTAIEALDQLGASAPSPSLLDAIFLYARNAVMLADHFVSSRLLLGGTSGLISNSSRPGRPSQDLPQHLEAIRRLSGRIAPLLTNLAQHLPALHAEDMEALRKQARGEFSWHNAAAGAVSEIDPLAGLFVLNCGGTGSGKTQCSAKVMTSAPRKGGHRLTVVQGLRTLTLQTGSSYRAQLGLDPSICQTLIGSRPVLALSRAIAASEQDDKPDELVMESGSDPVSPSFAEGPEPKAKDAPKAGSGRPVQSLLDVLFKQARTDDLRKMLETPVLASTIDYVMGAADWRRSRHLWPALRAMSSDFILDEIDDYSPVDAVAIGRLTWLLGAYGRRVEFSSATIAPEMACALAEAYLAGWKVWQALSGAPDAHLLVCSDKIAPLSLPFTDLPKGLADIRGYLHVLGEKTLEAAKAKPLRIGKVVTVSKRVSRIVDVIMKELPALHRDHGEEQNGRRLSFCLARFAWAKHAAKIAAELARRLKATGRADLADTVVRVISYQSRIPLAVRSVLEADLDDALRRNTGRSVFASRIGQAMSAEMDAAGVDNAIVLVVATPITEVGRDHDYDYAFVEPSSIRSIIQCAGRVNRHRRRGVTTPNIIILAHNLSPGERFQYPGYEVNGHSFDGLRNLTVSASGFCALPTAADILLDRNDPRVCPLARKEREVVDDVVAISLGNFTRSREAIYRDSHFVAFRFRGDQQSLEEDSGVLYYCLARRGWFQVEASAESPAQDVPVAKPLLPRVEGAWFYEADIVLARVMELAEACGCRLDNPEDLARFSRRHMTVNYSPELATHADCVNGVWKEDDGLPA